LRSDSWVRRAVWAERLTYGSVGAGGWDSRRLPDRVRRRHHPWHPHCTGAGHWTGPPGRQRSRRCCQSDHGGGVLSSPQQRGAAHAACYPAPL